jgi:tRNA G46 methylase TrmB
MQAHRDLIIEPVGLDVDKLPKPLNWAETFGNPHPVELEIGIGKGTWKSAEDVRRYIEEERSSWER